MRRGGRGRAIHRGQLGGIGPDEMLAWTRLMPRAATPRERALMLERMRTMLSASVLEELTEQHLGSTPDRA
jgi:hypothetical protein